MRRKSLLLALPVLVVLTTAFAVFVLEHQRTPDWQVALDDYLARRNAAVPDAETRVNVAAIKPWNFNEAKGYPQLLGAWPWDIAALPYPPDALRCVIVQRTTPDPSGAVGQLLFVAHHTDELWRAGWVVHEGPNLPLQGSDRTVLAEVGCAMASE